MVADKYHSPFLELIWDFTQVSRILTPWVLEGYGVHGQVRSSGRLVRSQSTVFLGLLSYQGTGPHNEFNGLNIVLRTVVVVTNSIYGSKSFVGTTLFRRFPAVRWSMHLDTYKTTR